MRRQSVPGSFLKKSPGTRLVSVVFGGGDDYSSPEQFMYILTAYLFVCHLEEKITDRTTCSWNNGNYLHSFPPLVSWGCWEVSILGI